MAKQDPKKKKKKKKIPADVAARARNSPLQKSFKALDARAGSFFKENRRLARKRIAERAETDAMKARARRKAKKSKALVKGQRKKVKHT